MDCSFFKSVFTVPLGRVRLATATVPTRYSSVDVQLWKTSKVTSYGAFWAIRRLSEKVLCARVAVGAELLCKGGVKVCAGGELPTNPLRARGAGFRRCHHGALHLPKAFRGHRCATNAFPVRFRAKQQRRHNDPAAMSGY